MKLLGIILITLSCNRIPFISKEEELKKMPIANHPLPEYCHLSESEDKCSIIICRTDGVLAVIHNPNCIKHNKK